jgi:alpha-2-macroglobulin
MEDAMDAPALSGAAVGRRRFWVTVFCFAIANVLVWIGYHQFMQPARRDLLRVEQFLPGNLVQVERRPRFVWRFNLDVMPTVRAAGGADAAIAPGSIVPAVAGRWEWADGGTLAFTPTEDLPKATTFVLTVAPDRVRSKDGYTLKEAFVSRVHTSGLTVRSIRQAGVDEGEHPIVELTFDDKVLPAEVLSHLVVTRGSSAPVAGGSHGATEPATQPASLKVTQYGQASDNIVRVVLADVLPANDSELHVELTPGLLGTGGPLGLGEPYEETLKLSGSLMVTGAESPQVSDGQPYINVTFNRAVDVDNLRPLLSVEPAVPVTVESYYRGLRLHGALEPGTRYVVKVAKGPVADAQKYPQAGTVSVLVPNRAPGVSFEHTEGYLGAAGNRTLLAHAVNAARVRVTVNRMYENNVVEWRNAKDRSRWSADPESYSRTVATRTIPLVVAKNKVQDLRLALDDLLPAGAALDGVYRVSLETQDELASVDEDGEYRPSGDRNASAVVTLSNIGLSAKATRDGLVVWAVGLHEAKPLGGVRVRVFSNKNQLLGEVITGADGLGRMEKIDAAAGEEPAVLLAEAAGEGKASGGLTWLDLRSGALDHADFDTAGEAYLRKGNEAFIYSDRGVYRPGETAVLRAIVRGANGAMPGAFPVQWQIRRPDLRDWKNQVQTLDGDGVVEWKVALPDDLPTGRWTVMVGLPGEGKSGNNWFGTAAFEVEEFMPDRMKVGLEFSQAQGEGDAKAEKVGARVQIGAEPLLAECQADYLFGKPAADRKATLEARLTPVHFAPAAWGGWSFGDAADLGKAAGLSPRSIRLDVPADVLDEKGAAQWELDLAGAVEPAADAVKAAPVAVLHGHKHLRSRIAAVTNAPVADMAYMGPWELVASASVEEIGGRAVTTTREIPVDGAPYYVGLRLKDYLAVQTACHCEVALVSPDGKPAERDASVKVEVLRDTWNNSLIFRDGHYSYESTRVLAAVPGVGSELTIHQGKGAVDFAVPEPGGYVVRVTDVKTHVVTTRAMYATSGEWWEDAISREKPDRLQVTVLPGVEGLEEGGVRDAASPDGNVSGKSGPPKFHVGEQARVRVQSPFAGELLLTVETDDVVTTRVIEMKASQTEIPIEITDAMRPNAYVTAVVVRAVDPGATWRTHRAFGIAPLNVDEGDRRLHIDFAGPTELLPNHTLDVDVHVTDAQGHAVNNAGVTLAAVDEGICQLTNFSTPDPLGYFTSRRALGVDGADIYSLLMPEVARPEKISPVGGDGGDEYDPRHRTPVSAKRVKPVALVSAIMHTDAGGVAHAHFSVPAFEGQLRLMAVAYAQAKLGSAATPVTVRSPLIVQSSWPRFAAPGDKFAVPIVVFNNTALAGAAKVRVKMVDAAEGVNPLGFEGTKEREIALPDVTLAVGGQGVAWLNVMAGKAVGVGQCVVTVQLGDQTTQDVAELPVRPASPDIVRGEDAIATVDKPAALVIPAGLVTGTGKLQIQVLPKPQLNLPKGLQYLDHYPYGCAEQTVSTCFPLVYLHDVGQQIAPGMFVKQAIDDKVQRGIMRLLAMETADGGVAMWPGYREDWPWASVYAAHFLVEARAAGHAVPEDFEKRLLAYLRTVLQQPADGDISVETQAYAAYVLALAGKPERTAMNHLDEAAAKMPAGSCGMSQVYLSAAWLAAGRRDRATALLADRLPVPRTGRQLGGDLASPVRDQATLLSTLLAVDPDRPEVARLARQLADEGRAGQWRSTQETALAVMALGHYLRQSQADVSFETAQLLVDHQVVASAKAGESLVWNAPQDRDLAAVPVEVQVTGKAGAKGFVGWLQTGVPLEPPADADHGVKVRRRYLDEKGGSLDGKELESGQLVQVELTIEGGALQHVVIEDLVPAGLEVENPRLNSAANGKQKPETPSTGAFVDSRLEVRDDRIVVMGDFAGGSGKYVYLARAVTPGTFVVPPVRAECMYDLGINSISGSGGTLTIRAASEQRTPVAAR